MFVKNQLDVDNHGSTSHLEGSRNLWTPWDNRAVRCGHRWPDGTALSHSWAGPGRAVHAMGCVIFWVLGYKNLRSYTKRKKITHKEEYNTQV